MQTYYFCIDTGKEMELWMKAVLDAALVQTGPAKRVDKITSEKAPTKETNNLPNHRVLIKPELQNNNNNNNKNKEMSQIEEEKALEAEKYGFQKDGQDNLRGGNYPSTGALYTEAEGVIQRTNSMQQLEQWINIQKGRSHEEETMGVISYQTLPRNMPSHRAQIIAHYPEGYRTLPRNSKARPESICSVTPSTHDKTLGPGAKEKRRFTRDDTMWQLYEWQQRHFYNKQSTLPRHDKVVHALEEKLQQLHKEKYTLEQALLSASQEIEMQADNPAAIQTVVSQRDDLQNGLLTAAELERAWREYDELEHDVTVTRKQMQEQLDHLGEVQMESAAIQRAQIQKELWRIQDVMEGLSKHEQQSGTTEIGMIGSKPFSTVKYKNEGPDYRLYKSEPELTTVAEVDGSNGEEKSERVSEIETSVVKDSHFPVGVVPPRTKSPTPKSST
ncbi:Pleckstrin y domain-containing A member 5 [Saguinus oedipus]|uniref:Pleckstrin y domain-containing A member 5 n=1 Tax=Saguinus oedipus TaxID=9490 RepID=A0ABQ9UXG9_SAGOE|nr:Pleckstrin y domain-containing A member 5 [Saguinus oedipus]